MIKKCVMLGVLVAAILSGVMVAAGDNNDPPKLSASGKAETEVKADAALVFLFLTADGILMSDTEKEFQEKYAKLEPALKSVSNDLKLELKTMGIGQKQNVYCTPDNQNKPQPEICKQIMLTLPPDPKIVAAIIDAAIRNGARLTPGGNNVYYNGEINSSVFYVLTDPAEVEKKVSELALSDLKKNAESLAGLVDAKPGRLLDISKGSPSNDFRRSVGIETTQYKYRSVDPEKVKVSITLSAHYELKN